MQKYRIKDLRVAKGWSQEQLATIAGLSTRTIQRIENGEQASLDTLAAIASALGLQVNELLIPAQSSPSGENVQEQLLQQIEDETLLLRKLARFIVLSLVLLAINVFTHSQYLWSLWVIGGLGLLLVMRAVRTLLLRAPLTRWQQRRLEHKLKLPH
ncbi:2TM domain-containing protein [Serratia fonticola]|uniref:2TM domain-containing protein n=1 Tax=Serratia fonticola TaxID=47917 RepID=A0A542D420_SERFO|nr:helix-turn-helix domain-containing protein [Serratia fonticola]TQI80168.1 2TM domain-containing protein [Serratia fonticola]TQI97805.1 2TM domain-containing protein [Serratia fonticola]TVZ72303.1 2TM domain-containing protein [Serratia fonticola]